MITTKIVRHPFEHRTIASAKFVKLAMKKKRTTKRAPTKEATASREAVKKAKKALATAQQAEFQAKKAVKVAKQAVALSKKTAAKRGGKTGTSGTGPRAK